MPILTKCAGPILAGYAARWNSCWYIAQVSAHQLGPRFDASSQLIDHGIPNRSTKTPNRLAQNVSWSGISVAKRGHSLAIHASANNRSMHSSLTNLRSRTAIVMQREAGEQGPAQRLDLKTLEASGDPLPLAASLAANPIALASVALSASAAGPIAYRAHGTWLPTIA
jgi:hypothetical protein